MSQSAKRIVLASRPVGEPKPDNFRLEDYPVPAPGEGQILLRTVWLSLDPYMRGRMSDVVSEEAVREFLECCPHAEYVDLEGAAHMVAGDKNDAFGEVVLDFVQRLRHK